MQNQDKSVLASVKFLATTLHEIRTPIQTIVGSVELLNSTNLDPEQKEYIRQIQFSAEALLSLANNILDYSKISNKDFHLENAPFDIIQLVESTTDLVSLEAFNKGLEIVTNIDNSVCDMIMGDSVRVQQILLNIIKNAVKFTATGFVFVKVYAEDDFLVFKIIDTGIGVPKESQAKLFDPYYQADASTTRNFGGTGLGLAICKSLVSAMKGSIGVTSNPKGGSIFYFKIPYKPIIDGSDTNYELVIPTKTKILLVDDSPIATENFKSNLQKFGIKQLYTASNAQQAIALMIEHAKKGEPFTAVFIDLLLPKVDGWHLAADINDNKEINNTKLYLIVPEGQMGGEARMKMLNWFDGYLYKPIKQKKLFELLSQHFKESFETAVQEQRDPSIILYERELAKKAKEENSLENKLKTRTATILKEQKDAEIASGLKTLVVEDHIVNRRLLVAFLTKFGATIFQAENGNEAINIFKEHPEIDYIFMDIQMPIKNGIDATKEIRKLGFKGIIIACTANSDTEDFEHYKKIGMNDVLVKPFKSQLVKETIKKWNTALILPTAAEIATLFDASQNTEKTWNEADFLDTVANDYNFGLQLIKDFIVQTEQLILSIPLLIQQKNFAELRRIGHTIKGSSSTISATLLSEFGTSLNKAAKSEDIDALKMNHLALCDELKNFKDVIKHWMIKYEL